MKEGNKINSFQQKLIPPTSQYKSGFFLPFLIKKMEKHRIQNYNFSSFNVQQFPDKNTIFMHPLKNFYSRVGMNPEFFKKKESNNNKEPFIKKNMINFLMI